MTYNAKSDIHLKYTPQNWFIDRLCIACVILSHAKYIFKSFPPGQNGRHFTDYIFGYIFMNEKVFILIKIPLKFVPNGTIDNKRALV